MTGPIVVAGASGFVGRHLVSRLAATGRAVRPGSRDPARARAASPGVPWVALDLDRPDTLDAALDGADALVFLVHRMREGAKDLVAAEVAAADRIVQAAQRAGVRRIVYLGGPAPRGTASGHLRARLATGEVLRSGGVSTIELRAGMVVGAGSQSWTIVRDLALRLPVMVLPRWLRHRTQPVGLPDVLTALLHAVDDPLTGSDAFDLPGPEAISGRDLLMRVAARAGVRPLAVGVPVLTPSLSSHWIRLVTRADFTVARQLVDGLVEDLVCPDDGYWSRIPDHVRVPLDEAIACALAGEAGVGRLGLQWERVARAVGRRPRLAPVGPAR